MKSLLKSVLLILPIFFTFLSIAQNSCFEKYHYSSNIIPEGTIEETINELNKKKQEFYEFIRNCNPPDFMALTIFNDTIELNKLKGKVVVINFWGIQCAPCIAEVPALNKLYDEYKDKDVVFIAPSQSSKEDILKNFMPKYNLKFNIIPDCGSIGEMGSLAEKYKLYFGWPTLYVLDKKGKVKFFKTGGYTDDRAKTEVYNLLKPIIDKLL